jgi:hypothetical protein
VKVWGGGTREPEFRIQERVIGWRALMPGMMLACARSPRRRRVKGGMNQRGVNQFIRIKMCRAALHSPRL